MLTMYDNNKNPLTLMHFLPYTLMKISSNSLVNAIKPSLVKLLDFFYYDGSDITFPATSVSNLSDGKLSLQSAYIPFLVLHTGSSIWPVSVVSHHYVE